MNNIIAPFFDSLFYTKKNTIEINSVEELKKIFRWRSKPKLNDSSIYKFEFIEDVNSRRQIDAEVLGTIVKNTKPNICIDIGTATGHSAALIAANAKKAKVYTVNISPDDIDQGKGGDLITKKFNKEEIGSYYKRRKLKNISQIYADTKYWTPDIMNVDFAFIDGCHDTDYIINDTEKILNIISRGGFITWHDFNPAQINNFDWIRAVSLGIEKLYRKQLLKGKIFHVKDSWIGIYRVDK